MKNITFTDKGWDPEYSGWGGQRQTVMVKLITSIAWFILFLKVQLKSGPVNTIINQWGLGKSAEGACGMEHGARG